MKRGKIMLIAIAVVATVGGALAFKAQRFAHKNIYCATINAQGQITCSSTDFKGCVLPNPFFTTPCITWHNALGLGAGLTSSYYTTNSCPTPFRACVTTTIIQ